MTEIAQPPRAPYVAIESAWSVAPGTANPEYTIPDAVLGHVVEALGLGEPHKIGIDPMCGNGTNLNFVNEAGGNLHGIELDRRTYEVARLAAAQIMPPLPPGWLNGQAPEVVHGDCTEVVINDARNGKQLLANYIYTSIPFSGVLDGSLGDDIVQSFDKMLHPHGAMSFIVVDSADMAIRDGAVVDPASATVAYFERSEFCLLDRIAFWVTNAPAGCDNQFTELMFVRKSELADWKRFRPTPLSGRLFLHGIVGV